MRKYFKEYLRGLEAGKVWNIKTISSWTAADGTSGRDVWVWLSKRYRKTKTPEATLKEVLGEEAEKLLEINPIDVDFVRIRDWGDVKRALLLFLETLEEGQTWSTVELWAWQTEEWNGRSIYKRFSAKKLRFCEETVREVLGEDAAVLDRKPLKLVEQKIRTAAQAKKYLIEYLEILKVGDTWSTIDVRRCGQIGSDGPNGSTLIAWVGSNLAVAGEISEEVIKSLLGKDAQRVLERNPFQKKRVVTSKDMARKYFTIFLDALGDNETWSAVDLQEWGEIQDGVDGTLVYQWVLRNMGEFNHEALENLLGDKKAVLKDTPFEAKHVMQITSLEIARTYFYEVLASLGEGKAWSPANLERFGPLGKGKPTGRSIYRWIIYNYGGDDKTLSEKTLRGFLGDKANEVLGRYPFQRIQVLTSRRKVAYYFAKFLTQLAAGQDWSAVDLHEWGEIADGVTGNALYHWISVNEPEGFSGEVLRDLLGEQKDLLDSSPYKRRNYHEIASADEAKVYIAEFLSGLRECRYWRPKDLVRHGRIGEDGPTGSALYRWLGRNVRYEDSIDWIYIVTKMIDLELLEKHPFRHEVMGSLGGEVARNLPALTTRSERFDTSDPDSRAKFIQGVEDGPETRMLRREEAEAHAQKQAALRKAVSSLDREEIELLNRWRLGEEIDQAKLHKTLEKLKAKTNE